MHCGTRRRIGYRAAAFHESRQRTQIRLKIGRQEQHCPCRRLLNGSIALKNTSVNSDSRSRKMCVIRWCALQEKLNPSGVALSNSPGCSASQLAKGVAYFHSVHLVA
jgi:hypothetical protein